MERKIRVAIILVGATVIIAKGVHDIRQTVREGRTEREQIIDDMGLDVAAIHRATDVVNARIDRGEIRSMDQLREAVLTEVAFQKISIREDM